GVPLLGPVDDYPVDPSHAGVLLDAAEPVTGRVYVRLGAGSPTGVGLLDLNLTVLAGSTVVAAGTVSQLVTSSGFVPFDFSLPVQAALVPADTLHAVVRAESGTNQYIFGYEGDHASRIALSPLTTGPLTAVATFVGSGAPVEDVALAFDATVAGGIAPFSFAWDFNGEGTSTDEDPSFAFPTAGLKTVTLTVTDAASNVGVSTLLVRVRQTDFVGAPRVVVALADSGINPYHETYRRPGIQLPLDELANASDGALPREIELTFGADHAANVAADAADWAGIGERELVWFKDTNVLGISIGTLAQVGGTRVLDDPSGGATGDAGGHGTATSDTVLDAWPDAIVVMVENSNGIPDDGIPEAFKWAIAQPWIDVISGSLGMPANVPEPIFLMQVAALQRDAWASGKLWVESAGNDPSFLPTDSLDGSPWVISVTGSQEGGEAKEINSGYLYADVASNFTVEAARYDSVDADASISGTSFSCPTVAGTLAGAIHELRRASGWTGGIEAGELVPPTDVANADLRNAMNKTALYHPFEGYLFGIHSGGDHGLTPLAPWTQVGWGHVDGTFVEDIVDVVSSADYALPAPPAEKGLAKIYMDVVAAERAAIWSTWVSAEEGNDVTGPGATVANGPVGTVQSVATIETPHPYAPDTEQAWTITVPGASAIQIHFEEFETETAFDFVFLEDLDGNVLAVYQGPASTIDLVVDDASAGPLDFWTVPVPGDTVVVHFTSDSFAEFHGFRIDEVAAT
ncbi:MAG TPA: S8 family serine peptidase, partial [Candidatus Thermoplasmatota archaeon]|nr:S8 family serine peptidase [Candidatus Thermoplasmatota archaeon]